MIYELEGKLDGKEYEIKLSSDGKVLEIEEEDVDDDHEEDDEEDEED